MSENNFEGKKNLVIATDSFLPRWDGISRFLSEIISRLHNTYNITVIAPDFGTYEDPNIKIIRIPLMKFFKIGDFPIPSFRRGTINSVIKNADIVFSQTLGPVGSTAIKAAKKYKKPVASFIHSIEWELVPRALGGILLKKYGQIFAKRFVKKMYNRCDLLIMPSQNISELFLWNNIRTKSKIVHLGVDTKKFYPLKEEQIIEVREQLGLLPNDIVIGYHGRIGREKDLITLLRAYSRIQQANSNAKLLIVGDGIESIKRQLASRPGVILTGSKNNPVPYLQVMDIYCMPSLTETTCLSALEAMSCQLPVISTEVGFIKSYIKHGYNGLFFEKQNQYPLAKNIQMLIDDPALRKKLGSNARKTVVEQFSWDKAAVGIEEALESLLKKK
ncbi:MAG TPA: glycosyltransferase family 4 protein [Alphaproteobacteria bacterium]|nr:glycosyltransferase family 4 protein [Alphaproteobacteria bacterium]